MAIIFGAPVISRECKGMTLVELMITLVISSFVIAALIIAFRTQESSSLVQETVTTMQQNNVAAMNIITQELRMAGYDPGEVGTPPATTGYTTTDTIPTTTMSIITATSSSIRFTMDLNNDGVITGSDEDVTYGFKTTATSDDVNSDGIVDIGVGGVADLRRKTGNGVGSGMQSMAEGLSAINFAYAYDSNEDGVIDQYTLTTGSNSGQQRTIWAFNNGGTWFNLDSNGDGVIDASDGPGVGGNGSIAGVNTGTLFNITHIRSVKIWILACSERRDTGHTNANTYTVGRQVITPNDRFYRRLMSSTVTCRNLGI